MFGFIRLLPNNFTTICPRMSDPINIVYYMKWVMTPWTYSMLPLMCVVCYLF